MTLKTFVLSVLFVAAALRSFAASDDKLTLWYQQPATKPMEEALAVGNGRKGALVFGAPAKERLCLNEDSLWTGDENPDGNYDTMGAYQVLGNLFVNLPGHDSADHYRRNLDLSDALAGVQYECNGVKFQREFFCSHPAGVLVARFTASKGHSYTGSIEAKDGHTAKTGTSGNRITVSGQLDNGLKYEWQLVVLHDGGTLSAPSGTTQASDSRIAIVSRS